MYNFIYSFYNFIFSRVYNHRYHHPAVYIHVQLRPFLIITFL